MTKPDWCPSDVWDASRNIQFHIPSGAAGPSQLAISQAIARAILAERERALEAAARYVEGYGGVIPGACVFGPLVSRNNMPDMSGDPRNRMHSHTRRDFDDATYSLASAIRALKETP